jgi:butyryl-CoA dehydrogenase
MVWVDDLGFELTEDEVMVRDAARAFATGKVAPRAAAIDKNHEFPRDLVVEMGKLGFLGATLPPEAGGSGLSTVAYVLIIEELAAACATTAIILSAHHSLAVRPLFEYGSKEQKDRYLARLVSGESLGCFALSEPGSGSDAAAMKCSAKTQGDAIVVNGTKNWITNGPESEVCLLTATEDFSAGYKGITAFFHPLNLEGVELGKREDKLGIRGSATCSIAYTDVKLSEEHVLGERRAGFRLALEALNGGRVGVAAQACGIARSALRDALSYAQQRKTFGKLIAEHQSIQNYLAEMVVAVDSARYLMLGAARRKDAGKSYIRQAAMAKYAASKAAMMCADKCVQIHGGYGYVTEFPAERHYRDAKITEIYEGTSEIQRMVIARELVREFATTDPT